MTLSDKNPVATITNNTKNSLDIYDTFSKTGANKGVLSYTKLGTIAPGAKAEIQTIHFASQLQAMRTGAIKAFDGRYYYQFPVAVMPILSIGDTKETTYTVTETDQSGMEQAFLFQRYVTANPDTKLSKTFFELLSGKDQMKKVNKFFSTTKNFSDCTLSMWTAVMNWMGQFPNAWQGTYYLYTIPAKGTKDVPELKATLVIASTAQKNSAVLTMSGSGGEKTNLIMNGAGFQEESLGSGDLSVALTPAWTNAIQSEKVNGKLVTKYLIGGALSGSINNTQVFGTGEKRPDQGETEQEKERREREYDRKFSHRMSIAQLCSGMLMNFIFLGQMWSAHKQSANTKTDEAAKKPGATEQSVESARKAQETANTKEAESVLKDNPKLEARASQAQSEFPAEESALASSVKGAAVEEAIAGQEERLLDVLKLEPSSPEVISAAQGISDANSDLKDGKVGDAMTQLKDTDGEMETALKKGGLKAEESDAFKDAREAISNGETDANAVEAAAQRRRQDAEDDPNEVDLNEDELAQEPESSGDAPLGPDMNAA